MATGCAAAIILGPLARDQAARQEGLSALGEGCPSSARGKGMSMSNDESTNTSADDQDDRKKPQLTVSEAGSSFSDPETSLGGADAVPGTPDGVLRRNRDENEVVDDDLLA